jgi:hypothetical protein
MITKLMSVLLGNFIAPQQNRPKYYAFGAELAELAQEDAELGSRSGLSEHARNAALDLSRSARSLLMSVEREDLESVRSINDCFTLYDGGRMTLDHESITPVSTILPWIADANPRDLAIFARWNTDRRHDFQMQLNTDQKELQSDTLNKVERVINIDLYPKYTHELYRIAMVNYGELKAMDGIESGAMKAMGWCDETTIALANLYTCKDYFHGIGQQLQGTTFHEYTHGAGNNGRGFSYGISTPLKCKHLFEEMFASYVTAVATAKPGEENTATFGLCDRDLSNVCHYPRERELMEYMNDGAIKPEKLVEAYFSQRDSKEGISLRTEVEKDFFRFFKSPATVIDLANNYSYAKTYGAKQHIINKAIADVLHTKKHYSDEAITDEIMSTESIENLAVIKDTDSPS